MSPAAGKKAILLPVKAFSQAKSRLAGLLSASERLTLMDALLLDAAEALKSCQQADAIAVVSSERRVLDRARQEGWMIFEEPSQRSESQSVDWASATLARRGFAAVLRTPVDIPRLRGRDLDSLLRAGFPGSAILVPSRDGRGTNALLRNPPLAFRSRFGPGSLRHHLEAAHEAGLAACVVENSRLGLDLDTPQDVRTFLQSPVEGHTLQLMLELKMAERLGRRAPCAG